MVRYAKSITINVALQDFTTQGYIYPPSIKIEYGSVSLADANSGTEVEVSLQNSKKKTKLKQLVKTPFMDV